MFVTRKERRDVYRIPSVVWLDANKNYARRKRRVALYSHDTMGLGHLRRNLLIAQTLSDSPLGLEILIITGSPAARSFSGRPDWDYLVLPSVRKDMNGEYVSRFADLTLQELIQLRSRTICAVLEEYRPDIFIVDKVPRGALGELDATLELLRNTGNTHCILGLRDILDDRSTVKREWEEAQNEAAIRRYYDTVWIYGDPKVFDAVKQYDFAPDIAEKCVFTGYHDQSLRLQSMNDYPAFLTPKRKEQVILCSVGGGQDGAFLAETFARARFPKNSRGLLLTGPFMSHRVRERLRSEARKNPRLSVLNFIEEPAHLLKMAERVICMGGYNSICEVLSFEKPALIVPRVVPRREQMIRAEHFRKLNLLDIVHWEELNPEAITEWMQKPLNQPDVRSNVDLQGLDRIPQYTAAVLNSESTSVREAVR